jgi:hypothetical protein
MPLYRKQVRLEDGVLRLARVEDRECGLRISHPEFRRLDVRVRVTAGRETDLGELRLVPAGRVRGRIVDARDVPVAGVAVFVAWLDSEVRKPAGEPLARTGADGRFDCRALQGARTPLVFWKDGFAPLMVLSRVGDDARSLDLRMLKASGIQVVLPARRGVGFVVHLAAREPLAEARDYAARLRFAPRGALGSEGPVRYHLLPTAAYTVTVVRQGGSAETVVADRVVETRAGETVTVDLSGR